MLGFLLDQWYKWVSWKHRTHYQQSFWGENYNISFLSIRSSGGDMNVNCYFFFLHCPLPGFWGKILAFDEPTTSTSLEKEFQTYLNIYKVSWAPCSDEKWSVFKKVSWGPLSVTKNDHFSKKFRKGQKSVCDGKWARSHGNSPDSCWVPEARNETLGKLQMILPEMYPGPTILGPPPEVWRGTGPSYIKR